MSGTEDHYRDMVEEYLDGDLSPPRARAFEAHVAACGECREDLEAARHIRRLARESRPVPVPEDLGERIRRRLEGRSRGGPGRVLALRWALGAAAAAVLLLVVFPLFQRETSEHPPGTEPPVRAATLPSTQVEDWLIQARNSSADDASFLLDEARAAGLLARVRDRLDAARGEERRFLLAVEDLLIQLENEPLPGELARGARAVARARPNR